MTTVRFCRAILPGLLVVALGPAAHTQSAAARPVVLVTAANELDTSATAGAAATRVGGVVVGGASGGSSTYVHSELWEVVRRFSEECSAATFVTNPATPHTMTIHTDYERLHSIMLGSIPLYQLALLDRDGNPLYVAKKNYLRRQIKPICGIIRQHGE